MHTMQDYLLYSKNNTTRKGRPNLGLILCYSKWFYFWLTAVQAQPTPLYSPPRTVMDNHIALFLLSKPSGSLYLTVPAVTL